MRQVRTTWFRWLIVAIVVIFLTLIAQGHEGGAEGIRVRVIPFQEYIEATQFLFEGHRNPYSWMVSVLIDGLGNLVVFMPLGAALEYALRDHVGLISKRMKVIALFGGGLSLSYEIVQYWIPGRVSAIDDVIINTTGTILGALLVLVLCSRKQRRLRSENLAHGR